MQHSIFFLILQKSKDNFFIECTQIKADLLQFDYLHDQEELLPLLEEE